MDKQYQSMGITLKGVDTKNNSLRAIFSTSDEDRHGDVVLQNWELDRFKANPVILNSHNYGDAAEVVGRAEDVKVVDGQLEGDIKFAVNENPKAKVIFDLYAGGFLNAFSVGFIPKEFSSSGQILKSELLEVSAVSVPANAMALAKSKGIDVEQLYEKQEDGEGITTDGSDNVVEDVEDTKPEGEKPAEPSEDSETIREEEVDELMEDAVDEVEEVKSHLKTISDVLSSVSEKNMVETRSKSVRAKNNQLINKTIRELIKIKKNYV